MTSPEPDIAADVIVVGLGVAGGCAAIAAHDAGAKVVVLEKQPAGRHYSNTRMSGGGFHSPGSDGDREALKAYAAAMFTGDGVPGRMGEASPHVEEMARLWAELSPDNEAFMRSLDPLFKTVRLSGAAFKHFPGAMASGYAVVRSSYTGTEDEASQFAVTTHADKSLKESGEAFHACLMTGIAARGIDVRYEMPAASLVMDGEDVAGVIAGANGRRQRFLARRGVVLASGGYEYNRRMREAFLDGPAEGWAFYGTPENTGDGIRMALKIGASLSHAGSVAGRVICAVPERRHGLKIGLNTASVGKPHEIVVDNRGARYASERLITKDPSRYNFYREALVADLETLAYPRIPSWMIFDTTLMNAGPLVRINAASYNGLDWGEDNRRALEQGWILQGDTLEELAARIRCHADGRDEMDATVLADSVARWNKACAARHDPDFKRDPATMGPIDKPPYYAIPLYPGGPNTKGGLRTDAQRRVLDWEDAVIPRLFASGEIASVFQFAYQGGGNLAEGITFGRLAGANAAALAPRRAASTGRTT